MIRLGKTVTGNLEFKDSELNETHMAVVGRVGQRKTLFLMSLLLQFVKLANHFTCYVDIGGDQAVYWLFSLAAKASGKPFYYFSLDKYSNCSWDPLRNTPPFTENRQAAVNGIGMGLRLEHSDGYGRTFWSRLSSSDINQALENLAVQGTLLPTFKEFATELRQIAEHKRGNQVSEAHLAADQLLRYSSIVDQFKKELYLGKAIEEDAIVLIGIPTALNAGAAKAIASLVVWCVTVEAAFRTASGQSPKTIHLAIDEFAQIAAGKSAVDSTLALARKWGVRMYLVIQDFEQLKTPDGDLTSILRSQCQQVLFTVESKEDQDALRYESKDIIRQYKGESFQGLSTTTQFREQLEPGLTRNEILDCNGVAMDAFGVFKFGDMHRDPIRFTVIPPTTKANHEKYKNKPIPITHQDKPRNDSSNSKSIAPDSDSIDRQKRYAEMMDRIKGEERWRMVGK